MKNVTITEISGTDVDFDQRIDSDEITATNGGIAVGGNVEDSVLNTGTNRGVMAGDDVSLDHSTVGNGNTQFNDSTVGAFSAHGSATNIQGQNLNLGSGDLIATDTHGGDAQIVNGNGNHTTGDIDIDAEGSDGPQNFVFGDHNNTQALEDNSTTIENSYNTDNSIQDSYNTHLQDSYNTDESYTSHETALFDHSGNLDYQDNDSSSWSAKASYEDNSTYQDNDTTTLDLADDADFGEV